MHGSHLPFPVPRSHSLPCDSFRFDSFSISLLLLMLLLCPLNLRHKTQSGKQTNKQANRHIDKQTNKQNRRANIFIKSPTTTPMRKASPFACFLCCDSAQLETPNWILEVGYCVRVVGGRGRRGNWVREHMFADILCKLLVVGRRKRIPNSE